MDFNKTHRTNVTYPSNRYMELIQEKNLMKVIPIRICGSEALQSFGSTLFFEHFIDRYQFEYVVEFGSYKGALSLYIANLAAATEQFLFHTFEFDRENTWYNRAAGGVGHWIEKIETITPYVKSFNKDIFSDEVVNMVKDNMAQYKTLIFCDGGDKAREFNLYSKFLKSGDGIVTHDWNTEIFQKDIQGSLDSHNIVQDDGFIPLCDDMNTLLRPFIKV